ncbi:MAG: HSP90 family protein [Phycisphaeraceae bacterium]|nr:MAG: HSP90 family protein [Phycisphaeraceae bacterium]
MSQRFQVDLRGIIDLLAHHLYESPEVFIRELVQNGADAITARRALEPEHRGTVRIELHRSEDTPATLIIEDDGIGLTPDEMHAFMSTIGASTKRDQIEEVGRGDFIGRFGIGLLSCFMVSDEIVAISRSARPGSPAVEWRGHADGRYEVRELDASSITVGTRIYVKANEQGEYYFDHERIDELAKRYCEMLPIRVQVVLGGDERDVNREWTPWDECTGETVSIDHDRAVDLCQDALGFRPIGIIPIRTTAGGVSGHAFIKPESGHPSDSSGHRVYLRRMFLSEQAHGLVPRWAFFVKCIFNAESLNPTASRESLYHDEQLSQASEEIGAQLRAALVRMAREDPEQLEAVLAVHDTALRALAREDDEFFDLIADFLSFETTFGTMQFGRFRQENEIVRVSPTSDQFQRIRDVAAGEGICVFNGGYTHHEELLKKAASTFGQLALQSFDSIDLIASLAEPVDTHTFRTLAERASHAIADFGCDAIVREFAPPEIPALYGLASDEAFKRSIERAKNLSSPFWVQALQAVEETVASTRPVLCLNARHPVIRRLAATASDEILREVVRLLYVQSLISGSHPLSTVESGALADGLLALIGRAISGSESL